MADVGIDDDFIDSVRSEVQPGTSALFVMTSDAVQDKVRAAFSEEKPTLLHTNLSSEEEARLRDYFSEDRDEFGPAGTKLTLRRARRDLTPRGEFTPGGEVVLHPAHEDAVDAATLLRISRGGVRSDDRITSRGYEGSRAAPSGTLEPASAA